MDVAEDANAAGEAGVFDILVPGHYFCDLIFTDVPQFPALGAEVYTGGLSIVPGGVLNTVVALRRLGVRVGWLGSLGSDLFSQFIRHWIEAEGVDTALLTTEPGDFKRVTVAISMPGDRAFLTYVDDAPDRAAMTLDALTRAHDPVRARHLHFTGLMADARTPDLLDHCHAQGMTVSMDCQYRHETLEQPLVREILSRLDWFMPNESEALRLTGTNTLEDAAARLGECVPHLLVKRGAAGASAWVMGERTDSAALALMARDTTGAGDVFNAGFLAAWLRGEPTATCLRWGNVCGGLSTQGMGGTTTAPTLAALRAYLEAEQDV